MNYVSHVNTNSHMCSMSTKELTEEKTLSGDNGERRTEQMERYIPKFLKSNRAYVLRRLVLLVEESIER